MSRDRLTAGHTWTLAELIDEGVVHADHRDRLAGYMWSVSLEPLSRYSAETWARTLDGFETYLDEIASRRDDV